MEKKEINKKIKKKKNGKALDACSARGGGNKTGLRMERKSWPRKSHGSTRQAVTIEFHILASQAVLRCPGRDIVLLQKRTLGNAKNRDIHFLPVLASLRPPPLVFIAY